MNVIYSCKNILTVYHFPDKNYITLKWDSFSISLDEIKKMHRIVLDYAFQHKCSIYVADTSDTITTLNEDIIRWWRDSWIFEMWKKGIKAIITILPRDIMAQISTFDWQKAEYGDIKMINVMDGKQVEKIIDELGIEGRS